MLPLCRTAVSAAALMALAQPLAALTAQQAWEGWKSMTEAYGQQVSSQSERYTSDTLVVSDARFSLGAEGEEVQVAYTVPSIAFAEQGDGSVEITLSDSYDVEVTGRDDEGGQLSGVLTVSHPGMRIIATEAGAGIRYDYAAPSASMVTGDFIEDGAPVDLDIELGTGPFSGTYTTMEADEIVAAFEGSGLTMRLAARDPETGGDVTGALSMSSLSVNSESTGGTLFGATDLGAQIAAGMEADFAAIVGRTTFDVAFDSPGDSGRFAGGFDRSDVRLSVNAERMDYGVTYDRFDLTVSGAEIPVPEVSMAMEGFELGLDMPVAPSDTAAPFRVRAALEGVSLGDAVWNLFDPAAVLPRGGAALVLELAGTGRWLVDITQPEIEDTGEPAEIEALSINEILLRIAGAEMTATGGFSFDYADRQTFDGMPRPEGSLNVVLTGANTLLDRLVQMGVLPPEQAMTARMMSGMVLRPGTEPDTLISDIEITPSGRITANGAPLPF